MFSIKTAIDPVDGFLRVYISHNGMAWSTIELRTPAEGKALYETLADLLAGKIGHSDHAWDCFIHDGYNLCNCGALMR